MHIYARGRHGAHAHIYNEIMRPYAGIIRIRFMGMISASVTRAPLQIYVVPQIYETLAEFPTPIQK